MHNVYAVGAHASNNPGHLMFEVVDIGVGMVMQKDGVAESLRGVHKQACHEKSALVVGGYVGTCISYTSVKDKSCKCLGGTQKSQKPRMKPRACVAGRPVDHLNRCPQA